MRQDSFICDDVFGNVIRTVGGMFAGARRRVPLVTLCLVALTALTAGVVRLAQNPLACEVLRISVHRAAGSLHLWPARNVLAQQPDASSTPSFTVFDAPGAGTGMLQGTMGTSINDAGVIAGIYLTAPNVAHGFVRAADGTIATFDAPNAGTSLNQGTFPASINAGGDIAGMYFAAGNSYHGFVRAGATGTITEFDVPGAPTTIGHRGTLPMSINAGGDITGFYVDANDVRHGFVRLANGTFSTIDAPAAGTAGTQGTTALNINLTGDITGLYRDAAGTTHGFVRAANGTITAPLDAPGAGTGSGGKVSFGGTLPTSINASKEIAGVFADSSGKYHGFVYTAGNPTPAFTTFDVPGAGVGAVIRGTASASINSGGDISGVYSDSSGVSHGFLRAGATGTITAPLDAPNAATSGMFAGTVLISINATDQITGTFEDTNGVFHGFLLTTAPPPAATPTFSPAAGTYPSAQSVTIADATSGATIYYTTDGSTPTTSSAVYSSPISVTATETIKAIATATGFSTSALGSATYTIAPATATPTFSPAAGTYNSAQSVTISDTTTGATIYYTTDGSTPTTSSTVYSSPISVTVTETIEAIATASGFSNSAVATATYTITGPPPAATPTFSPTPANYTSQQMVTISDTTSGASIYFTIDGSTPTISSTKFTSPIAISSTTTFKAIATATGFSTSAVGSATYTFNPDFQVSVNPTTLTIVAGQSGKATFTVTPVNGFNSAVNFSCSGLPAEAACSFNPSPVTPNGSAVSTTLTVTTTAKGALLAPPPGRISLRPIYAFACVALGLLFSFAVARRQRPRALQFLCLLLLLTMAASLASCTGNGGNKGTPPGTDTVSVAASTSGSGSLSHSATLTITITQ